MKISILSVLVLYLATVSICTFATEKLCSEYNKTSDAVKCLENKLNALEEAVPDDPTVKIVAISNSSENTNCSHMCRTNTMACIKGLKVIYKPEHKQGADPQETTCEDLNVNTCLCASNTDWFKK